DSIKHEIVWFDSWSQAPQLLNDGGAVFVQSANGRFFDAIRRENKPFTIVWDGHLYDLDAWGIVKGTPKLKEALNFVAFTTTTKALAGVQDVAYGPPRRSSMALVDKDVVDHLPTAHIDVGLKADGIFWADHGENLGDKFNEWLIRHLVDALGAQDAGMPTACELPARVASAGFHLLLLCGAKRQHDVPERLQLRCGRADSPDAGTFLFMGQSQPPD